MLCSVPRHIGLSMLSLNKRIVESEYESWLKNDNNESCVSSSITFILTIVLELIVLLSEKSGTGGISVVESG